MNEAVDAVISQDIILRARPEEAKRHINRARIWQAILTVLNWFHWPLLIGGTALSLYAFWSSPTVVRGVAVGIYVILWLTKIFSATKYRRYGMVVDNNGKPLSEAIVELTKVADNNQQHILSTITDAKGRFILLAPSGVYDLTVAKEGYSLIHRSITADETGIKIKLEPNQTSY